MGNQSSTTGAERAAVKPSSSTKKEKKAVPRKFELFYGQKLLFTGTFLYNGVTPERFDVEGFTQQRLGEQELLKDVIPDEWALIPQDLVPYLVGLPERYKLTPPCLYYPAESPRPKATIQRGRSKRKRAAEVEEADEENLEEGPLDQGHLKNRAPIEDTFALSRMDAVRAVEIDPEPPVVPEEAFAKPSGGVFDRMSQQRHDDILSRVLEVAKVEKYLEETGNLDLADQYMAREHWKKQDDDHEADLWAKQDAGREEEEDDGGNHSDFLVTSQDNGWQSSKKKLAGSSFVWKNRRRLHKLDKSKRLQKKTTSELDAEDEWAPERPKKKRFKKRCKKSVTYNDEEATTASLEEDEVADGDYYEEETLSDDDLCALCKKPGNLIVCDGGSLCKGCGNAYHVACIARRAVPDGDWICQTCSQQQGFAVGVEGHEFKPNVGSSAANSVVGSVQFVHKTTPYDEKTVMVKPFDGNRKEGQVYANDRSTSFRQQLAAVPRSKVHTLQKYVECAQRMATPLMKSDSYDADNEDEDYRAMRGDEAQWPDVIHFAGTYREQVTNGDGQNSLSIGDVLETPELHFMVHSEYQQKKLEEALRSGNLKIVTHNDFGTYTKSLNSGATRTWNRKHK